MKRILSLMVMVILAVAAKAQSESRPLIRGELLSDQRLLLKQDNDWAWNETRLDLKLDKRTEKVKFYGNVWLRHLGAPLTTNLPSLYSKDHINPWNVDLREAYAEVNGFLFENLDMKIGRQRIAWGTADKFNPTDNVNPYDLEDLLDFGRHQGSEALSLTWHMSEQSSLQGVYLPFFRPSSLPLRVFSNVLGDPIRLPEGLQLADVHTALEMPAHNFSQGAIAGLRFKSFLLNTDVSLSYLYGRDGLPFLKSTRIVPLESFPQVNVEAILCFPRQHVFGADMAGSVGNVGVWAEAAVFLPEKDIYLSNDISLLFPMSPKPVIQDTLVLEKKPYMKLALGADYSFSNGAYLNVQYLRGFIHERGKGNMNDYLMLALEKSFFSDRLLFRPLAGGLAVSDWDAPADNFALFYTPELMYKGIDNLQIGIGAYFFEGKGSNMFAGFGDFNMIQAKAKLSF